MKRLSAVFLAAAALHAQMINAGGAATGAYLTDQGFIGGAAYGPNSQADPGWKAQPGIYSTLRYGTAFSYDLAAPNGSCSVKLDLIENRPAVSTLGVPASGVGLRVFTVAINGTVSAPIDIFAAAGAQTPYSPPPTTVAVTTGHLRLDFKASVGNAVVSGIEATCTASVSALPLCPIVAANTVVATLSSATLVQVAHQTPGALSDCMPGPNFLVVMVDSNGTPAGTYVPGFYTPVPVVQ